MNKLIDLPNSDGFFGEYGGKFVPETLMHALNELDETYSTLKSNPKFIEEIDQDLVQFVGRPLLKLSVYESSGPLAADKVTDSFEQNANEPLAVITVSGIERLAGTVVESRTTTPCG